MKWRLFVRWHDAMMAQLVVTFRPHWVNGWFLYLFAQPYIEVDGTVTCCSWTSPTTIDASPGAHRLRTFIRYRRIPRDLGSGTLTVDLPTDGSVHVTAANGLTNDTPFTPHVTS